MVRHLIREGLFFFLDFFTVYISILLFSIHISLLFFIPHFQNIHYSAPVLFSLLLLVMVCRVALHPLQRSSEKAASVVEAGFFALVAAVGLISLWLTARLVWFHISFPKILLLCAVVVAARRSKVRVGFSLI